MNKRLSTQDFIQKARKIHGDQYGYPQTRYKTSSIPVIIVCQIHGPFRQRPDNHLAGKGCKQCARERNAAAATMSTEEFVERAHTIYGEQFDYSESIYKNSDTPVIIVCRIHGPFSQNPYNHLIGKIGCKHCAGNQHPSDEQILQRLRIIHGDHYQYDLSAFTTTKQRLQASCAIHGPFTISYYRHLKGAGCPGCTSHYAGKAAKYFVIRARAVHGTKYRYGPYKSAPYKIEINCPVHGLFYQSPASHLQGHGCPRCANDRKRLIAKGGYSGEFFALHPEMKQRPATLYVIEFAKAGEIFIKVGITRTSIKSRFRGGYKKYSWRLVASRSLCLYEAFCLEQKLLDAFKSFQVFPKQDNFVGKTECLLSSCVGEVESWLQEHDAEAKPSN